MKLKVRNRIIYNDGRGSDKEGIVTGISENELRIKIDGKWAVLKELKGVEVIKAKEDIGDGEAGSDGNSDR